MDKIFFAAAIAGSALIASPAAAQVVYDANPTVPFTYGTGNGYTPANAVVYTNPQTYGGLALRAHVPGQTANATGGTGIYIFDLGSAVSFDFSAYGDNFFTTLTVTNLLTGDDASFDGSLLGSIQSSGAMQGSQQLGFGFLNGSILPDEDINFDNAIDNTFRIDLLGGGVTITAFAQLGAGVPTLSAVPEPGTWAMMILGFGAVGGALRRRAATARQSRTKLTYA